MCVEGKLCLGKQVPTPAPGITKKAFFAHQWLPLTPGPLPLEGMSGFPRWHTELAIIEAGSRGGGHLGSAARIEMEGYRGYEVAFCVLNPVL